MIARGGKVEIDSAELIATNKIQQELMLEKLE